MEASERPSTYGVTGSLRIENVGGVRNREMHRTIFIGRMQRLPSSLLSPTQNNLRDDNKKTLEIKHRRHWKTVAQQDSVVLQKSYVKVSLALLYYFLQI